MAETPEILPEIKATYRYHKEIGASFYTVDVEDMAWLIDQLAALQRRVIWLETWKMRARAVLEYVAFHEDYDADLVIAFLEEPEAALAHSPEEVEGNGPACNPYEGMTAAEKSAYLAPEEE